MKVKIHDGPIEFRCEGGIRQQVYLSLLIFPMQTYHSHFFSFVFINRRRLLRRKGNGTYM